MKTQNVIASENQDRELNAVFGLIVDRACNQAERGNPGLAVRLPFEYRAVLSPFRLAIIEAVRQSRRCGKAARWTADKLNSVGVFNRGQEFTEKAIVKLWCRFPDQPGSTDMSDAELEAVFTRLASREVKE